MTLKLRHIIQLELLNMRIFFLIRNLRIENFGPLGFPVTLYCNAREKMHPSTYCWAILDTVRCRFFGASPWTSTRTLPWNCWGLVAPASTQIYCAMTDSHCMLCLRHDTRPRPKGKRSMTGGGGGAIDRAASPAASVPPRHWI